MCSSDLLLDEIILGPHGCSCSVMQMPTSVQIHTATEIHQPLTDESRRRHVSELVRTSLPRRRCTGTVEQINEEIVIMMKIADKTVLVTGAIAASGKHWSRKP